MEDIENRGEKPVLPTDDSESNNLPPSAAPSLRQDVESDWETHPENPYNWSRRRKVIQVAMMSAAAFTACV